MVLRSFLSAAKAKLIKKYGVSRRTLEVYSRAALTSGPTNPLFLLLLFYCGCAVVKALCF
jgi:hypothetical protein